LIRIAPRLSDKESDALRAGIAATTAYDMAVSNFILGGVNRVILATDGDFNIGIMNRNDLVRLIEDKAKRGVRVHEEARSSL